MKKKLSALILLSYFSMGLANISPAGFEQFNYNNYFVETGTYLGDGIKFALRAGFKHIRSIEISSQFVDGARKRFGSNSSVKIIQGNSANMLWDVIKDIDEPITFWLDGHQCPAVVGEQNCPLLDELEQIKRHSIKKHTILIDDMHCLDTDLFDYISREMLVAKIMEINPNYTISYVPGGNEGEYPNNIMVATVGK